MKKSDSYLLLALFAVLVPVVVFFKNAWVSDDAYIIFRSIEQLFAGNGPVWNPHERVQVFTSPLWFVVLSFTRIFSSDVFLNAIGISFVLLLSMLIVLRKLCGHAGYFLLISILLVSSNAFFDYTSSGLENVLGYFLLAGFAYFYHRLFLIREQEEIQVGVIRQLLICFGLVICVRHDLLLLTFPAVAYAVFTHFKFLTVKQWLREVGIAFVPIGLYTLFSVIYYGFPFPNTAYAKLTTGIPASDLVAQGFKYYLQTFQFDSLTGVVIITALVVNLAKPRFVWMRYVCIGIILNLLYVLKVGGDFMQGRFLSYSFLWSSILLVQWFAGVQFQRKLVYGFVFLGAYFIVYPHTPLTSPIEFSGTNTRWGIADERGYYFKYSSLGEYLRSKRDGFLFPQHKSSMEGLKFKEAEEPLSIMTVIGFYGYHAGLEKMIVDPLALSDPLLARLPARTNWRIGHFERDLPEGYIESIVMEREALGDPGLLEYYRNLQVITKGEDLFDLERLKMIFLFNIGAFDHLINGS